MPLADGVWEIEARPSQWFWDECRGRRIVTLIAGEVGSGGDPLQGLPAIQNLRREIVNFQSAIKWKVAAEYEPGAFRFGLWFGPTSPVDTSGAPDQVTIPYYSGRATIRPPVRKQARNTWPWPRSRTTRQAPFPNCTCPGIPWLRVSPPDQIVYEPPRNS